jgi:beta-lactamase class D
MKSSARHRRPLAAALLALPLLAGCGADAASDAEFPATLGALTALESPAAPGGGEPNLSVGPDGRIYLSWLEPAADSAHALRFAVLEGEAWSAPRTIAEGRDFFVNWADFPSLVALPDGRLAAHWLERTAASPYAYGVRIVQSADGGATWSAPVTPHRDATPTEHGFVSLFPLPGDSLGAIWLDGRRYAAGEDGTAASDEMMLAFTTIAPSGEAAPERMLDERVCDCCQTAVALTSRGPVAVYRDRSADEVRDIYTVRRVNGRWSEPRPVHADGWRIEACPVNGPAIAAAGERVAVAWFTAAQDTARVRVAFSDDAGASFGAPVRIDDGDPAGRVGVVLLDDGRALVSWIERTGDAGAEVRARTVAPGGTLGAPLTVAASSAARASGFPRIARSGDQVIFAWTEPGEPSAVRTARLRLSAAASAATTEPDFAAIFGDIDGAFVLLDAQTGRTVRHNPERAATRFLPASTYKIPNTLIALETGVAGGADFALAWDSTTAPRQAWWPASWARDHTLATALPNSVVWFYQEIARRVGAERMQSWLDRFGYGNADISGGIDTFWLTGGLRISPDEQVDFLRRFYSGELGVSERSTELAKRLLVLEETPTYRLSGKTGWAGLGEQGEPEVGWLVGYLERGGDVYFYATNVEIRTDADAAARMKITKAALRELGLIEGE